jgi:aryl-alcohol dehydrogenase-like predicted oxidoreductase
MSALPTTRLGETDMFITRVGFGAWAVGGAGWAFGWGAQDDAASIAAIRHAVESGINWVDTAAVYGLGHSEQVVAKALADLPESDRPFVFTKGGLVWDDDNPAQAPRRIGDPVSIRREVDASLRRLQVDRIDLYQMHWPADDRPVEDYWSVFDDLVSAGKVRAIGLSNHDTTQLSAAASIAHVDSLQPPLNLIRRDAAADVIPWSFAHGTGVIVYSPMASGLLTGAFDERRAGALQRDDWRSSSPDFTGPGLRRNLALAAAMKPIADRYDVQPGAVAVAWTLSVPGVSGAIVGARSAEQVDGWLPAARLTLNDTDLDELTSAIASSGAGSGPRDPRDVDAHRLSSARATRIPAEA